MRKEMSQSSNDGHESPIIKSLFDIKGNSKFKNDNKQLEDGKSLNDSSSSSSDEEEESK